MKLATFAVALSVSLSLAACKNPADGKTKAVVEEAKPEGTAAAPAPAPAEGTPAATAPAAGVVKYAIAPDTSTVALTGSKVTKSHALKVPKFTGSIEVTDGKPETAKVA